MPSPPCPAGLLENPKSTGRNHPAPSSKNLSSHLPWAGLRALTWTSLIQMETQPRPHAGRQVWPKLHYGYLITSPSQQESNPTGTSSFLSHFYSGENSVHAASEWMLATLQAQSSLKLPWFTWRASDCQHLADTATNSVINRSHTI